MRAPELLTSNAGRQPGRVETNAARNTSARDVSDRFAALFYRRLLRSMMNTIPGRDDRSAVGNAGWKFMTRYLPRSMARGKDDPVGRYIRKSLQSRPGGQVNAEL